MRQSTRRSWFTRTSDPRHFFKAWRRRPSLELLENRLALAATTFVNDNWHLVTDNGDAVLSIGDIVRNDNDTINAGTVTAAYGIDGFGTVTTTSVPGVTGTVAGAATINDAIANTNSGGTANVLEGTYLENVNIITSLTLRGSGPTATVIDPAAGSGISVTASDATIQDLRVTGAVNGIIASGVVNLTISDVRTDANTISGINVISASGTITLHDNIVTGNTGDGVSIIDGGAVTTFTNGTYSNNGDDGIDLNSAGAVSLSDVTASGNGNDGVELGFSSFLNIGGGSFNANDDDGLDAFNLTGAVVISNASFNDNDADNSGSGGGDGIDLDDVGAVTLASVTATGNDPGVFVTNAASFSDTDGVFTDNDDHGIQLVDIAGDVTLVRTVADDNDTDNDNIGDGLNATAGGNPVAIGGNLIVQGARFRDTGGAADHQERGVFVASVNGTITFNDSTGIVQSNIVTGNENKGVFIPDGGTSATCTNGMYSGNADNGIDVALLSGAMTLSGVTASNNGSAGDRAGVFAHIVGSFADTGGIYQNNTRSGLFIEDVAGDVTLVRTTAENNDFNNNDFGDGVTMAPFTLGVAIGGNLLVQGGFYRDTGGVADHQERGIFVDSITGSATFEDSAVPVQSVTVTGNEEDGVLINDGGSSATFTNGTYSNNGDDGIDLNSAGAVLLTGVSAGGNASDGVELGFSASLTIDAGSFNSNNDDGLEAFNLPNGVSIANASFNDNDADNGGAGSGDGIGLDSIGNFVALSNVTATGNDRGVFITDAPTVNLRDLTITGNTAGGELNTVTNVSFQGTSGDVVDVITASGVNLQHTRDPLGANVVNQAISLASVANLRLIGDGGDDTFNVTPAIATIIDVDGDTPTPPATPGDTLNVNTGGTANPSLLVVSTPSGLSGTYAFTNRQPVNFQEIESLNEASTTTLVGAPNPSVFGQTVTFTATVSPALGSGPVPTGSVTFVDTTTGTTLGTVALSAAGTATLNSNVLAAGSHTIQANYQGDDIYAPSSGTFTQTVDKATTTTIVTSSTNPSVFGQPVTFTATVSANAPATATPTGTVTFVIDGNPVATVPLNASGQATVTTSNLIAGTHPIVATFNGDANFNASSASLTQIVNPAATTTAIASTPNPSTIGQPVTFTATVSATAPSLVIPTGSVVFNVDGSDVATVGVNVSGQATFTTSSLTVGPHAVFARYVSSTPNFTNSVSPTLTQNVNIAAVTGGKLLIEGTSDNDIVTITGVGTGTGVYIITFQQGAGPVQTQTVTGVTTDICVFLHAGNDQLTMNNVFINGSIIVEMDTGNDTVTLGHANVVSTKGDLDINLGTDNDALNGRRIFIGGNQNLIGGDGNDTMTFDGFASPFTLGTSGAGNANWLTGSGNDAVNVVYAFIGGAWAIDLGAGTDSLNIFGSSSSGNMSAVGGAGDDTMTVNTNFFDSGLFLDGGAENDTIFLANGLGTELAAINTGAGSDTITVRNQTAAQLVIDSGTGNDTVETRSSAFDRFFAIMGDDDDQLTLFGNLFRFEMDLDGGNGIVDRLLNLGNDVRGAARARNFELFG